MTTTTPTPTATFTDRWQIAADFAAMGERGELVLNGIHVHAASNPAIDVHVTLRGLRTGYDLLDDPTVTTSDLDDKGHVNLYVDGGYRGFKVLFYGGAHTPADLDLVRSFVDENGKPNFLLLDALVDASREG